MQLDQFSLSEFRELKAQLSSIGRVSFKVVSGSMSPWLRVGESSWVLPLPKEIDPFTPIVFWDGKVLVCHMVITQSVFSGNGDKKIWLTQGLANTHSDLPVPEEHILGIVEKRLPWWRKLIFSIKMRRRA